MEDAASRDSVTHIAMYRGQNAWRMMIVAVANAAGGRSRSVNPAQWNVQRMENVDTANAVFMTRNCPPGFPAVKLASVDHVLLCHANMTNTASMTVIA